MVKKLERMNINIQKIKVSIIYILVFILYNLILYMIPDRQFEIWVKTLAGVCIVLLAMNTSIFFYMGKKIFSVAYIFVVLSFLFHMGQVILHAFFKNYDYIITDFLEMYPNELTKNALLFSINIIQIVTLFIILSTDTKLKRENRKPRFNKIDNKQLKNVGWIMCIITVPMKFIYIKKAIDMVRDETYVTATVEGFSGVYIQISNFCIIAFVVMLLAYSDNNRAQKIILSLGMIFFLWSMLSGGRIYGVISIIILFLCYFHTNYKKISFKGVVLIAIIAILFLQIITTITHIRATHDFNIISIVQYAFSHSNNVFLKVLDEFGGTEATVIFTFDEVPRNLDFHKGLSYIKAWLLVGLNINGVLDQISKEIAYTTLFFRQFNLGGSYIGELYYNFGYWGYLFATIIGVFIGKLSEISEYCLEKRLVIEFALFVMPIFASISWIRGYFDSFSRSSVWGTVFIVSLYFICRKFDSNKICLKFSAKD